MRSSGRGSSGRCTRALCAPWGSGGALAAATSVSALDSVVPSILWSGMKRERPLPNERATLTDSQKRASFQDNSLQPVTPPAVPSALGRPKGRQCIERPDARRVDWLS